MPRVTEAQKQEIIHMYESGGETCVSLGEKFNISNTTVHKILKTSNVILSPANKQSLLSNKDIEEIIEKYKTGNYTCPQLCKMYNVSNSVIYRTLLKNEVEIHRVGKLTDEDKDEIVTLYLTGDYSLSSLAKLMGVGHCSIVHLLRKRAVKDLVNPNYSNRIYTLNEAYFDEIDNPEKVYILGLIYTDGCHSPENNCLDITLQARDRHILDHISILMGSNKPLSFKPRTEPHHQDKFSFRIFSKRISDNLIKWGVPKAKTFILTWPTWLTKQYYKNFILGLIDGDGGIEHGNINFCGVEDMCRNLKEFLWDELQINSVIYPCPISPGIERLMVMRHSNMKPLLYWLYSETTLCIERKLNSALRLLHWITQDRRLRNASGEFLSTEEMAQHKKSYNLQYYKEHPKRKEVLLTTQERSEVAKQRWVKRKEAALSQKPHPDEPPPA